LSGLPNAPSAERNQKPILEVLRLELQGGEKVLEIGSGTGQHAVCFASELPGLTWQTSDVADNHPAIMAWREWSGLSNVEAPLKLDVAANAVIDERFDAVFSANTAHIMDIGEVECMFAIAGRVLNDSGSFFLYGPFKHDDEFSTDSNAQFDRTLKSQKPTMGIRDLQDLDTFAGRSGMCRARLYAMPANNMLVVWRRTPRDDCRPNDAM